MPVFRVNTEEEVPSLIYQEEIKLHRAMAQISNLNMTQDTPKRLAPLSLADIRHPEKM